MAESAVLLHDATEIVLSNCWAALLERKESLNLPKLRITSLDEFLAVEAAKLATTRDEKLLLLKQASLLLNGLYAHVGFKKRPDDVDAHRLLRELAVQVERESVPELTFHLTLLQCFATMRDSHTTYILPQPLRSAVAFLPFQMRHFSDGRGMSRFLVTKTMETDPPNLLRMQFGFGRGAEILQVGGAPVRDTIDIVTQLLPGSNRAANIAYGAAMLTLRPLGRCAWLFTSGERVMTSTDFVFRPAGGGKPQSIRFPWGVARGFTAEQNGIPEKAFSQNEMLECTMSAGRVLMDGSYQQYGAWARQQTISVADRPVGKSVVSSLPEIFQVQHTDGDGIPGFTRPDDLLDEAHPSKRFAHLRIRTFAPPPLFGSEMVEEFGRILRILNKTAPDGLILDIRGNTGGDITVAERMLRFVSPRRIEPCRFHFARTQAMVDLLRHVHDTLQSRRLLSGSLKAANAEIEFTPWLEEIEAPAVSEDALTAGHPLTDPEEANIGKRAYVGPIVLLVDARTYSAAEIFAAGFQDHGAGVVAGPDRNTGGGGANVWSHEQLRNNVPGRFHLSLRKLPKRTSMSVAIRRARRVGLNEGVDIEDVGVGVDLHCPLTRDDLLGNAIGPVRACLAFLGGLHDVQMEPGKAKISGRRVEIPVRCRGIHQLECSFDRVRYIKRDVPEGDGVLRLSWTGERTPRQLVICGLSEQGGLVGFAAVDLLRAKQARSAKSVAAS